jgi:hypothetical protein
MKFNRFFAKLSLLLACVGWILSSCTKGPELYVSSNYLTIDPYPDTLTFDISANIHWTISIIQTEKWLTVNPVEGKGNHTITLIASENEKFTERTAFIAISGDEAKTDTIKIIQTGALDVVDVIEDAIFRKYCLDEFDNFPKDGKLSLKETKNAIKINVNGLKISSLAGIEYFTNITELLCSSNHIKSLDISKNKDLKKLDCSFNPINDLDVSELTKLLELFIDNAEFQTINVSKNVKLYWLSVSHNQLTSLDLDNNTDLEILECNENNLNNLGLSKNIKLTGLFCIANELKTIDLNMNKALVNLWCNNNQINRLELSQNTALQRLSCAKNSLTDLSLSNQTALIQLLCDNNQLQSLNVSKNTKLEDLRCTGNRLTGKIDVSNNRLLAYLYLQDNPLLNEILVWQGFNEANANYHKDATAKYTVVN